MTTVVITGANRGLRLALSCSSHGRAPKTVSKMSAPFIGRTDDPVDVQLAGTVHVFDTAGQRIATTGARFAP